MTLKTKAEIEAEIRAIRMAWYQSIRDSGMSSKEAGRVVGCGHNALRSALTRAGLSWATQPNAPMDYGLTPEQTAAYRMFRRKKYPKEEARRMALEVKR